MTFGLQHTTPPLHLTHKTNSLFNRQHKRIATRKPSTLMPSGVVG